MLGTYVIKRVRNTREGNWGVVYNVGRGGERMEEI